jgi:hypothetical protein
MRSILPETYINLILGYIQGEDFHRKHRLRAYIIVNLSTCEEALNKMDIQINGMWGNGWIGLVPNRGEVADTFECGNKPLGSIK